MGDIHVHAIHYTCSHPNYLVYLPFSDFRIYEMELRLDTPIKFRHPFYEALTWFAAKDYIKELKSYSEKGIPPPIYLLEGMKEMLYCFSMWTRSREVNIVQISIPPTFAITVQRMIMYRIIMQLSYLK